MTAPPLPLPVPALLALCAGLLAAANGKEAPAAGDGGTGGAGRRGSRRDGGTGRGSLPGGPSPAAERRRRCRSGAPIAAGPPAAPCLPLAGRRGRAAPGCGLWGGEARAGLHGDVGAAGRAGGWCQDFTAGPGAGRGAPASSVGAPGGGVPPAASAAGSGEGPPRPRGLEGAGREGVLRGARCALGVPPAPRAASARAGRPGTWFPFEASGVLPTKRPRGERWRGRPGRLSLWGAGAGARLRGAGSRAHRVSRPVAALPSRDGRPGSVPLRGRSRRCGSWSPLRAVSPRSCVLRVLACPPHALCPVRVRVRVPPCPPGGRPAGRGAARVRGPLPAPVWAPGGESCGRDPQGGAQPRRAVGCRGRVRPSGPQHPGARGWCRPGTGLCPPPAGSAGPGPGARPREAPLCPAGGRAVVLGGSAHPRGGGAEARTTRTTGLGPGAAPCGEETLATQPHLRELPASPRTSARRPGPDPGCSGSFPAWSGAAAWRRRPPAAA